jgi:hypothetical protein
MPRGDRRGQVPTGSRQISDSSFELACLRYIRVATYSPRAPSALARLPAAAGALAHLATVGSGAFLSRALGGLARPAREPEPGPGVAPPGARRRALRPAAGPLPLRRRRRLRPRAFAGPGSFPSAKCLPGLHLCDCIPCLNGSNRIRSIDRSGGDDRQESEGRQEHSRVSRRCEGPVSEKGCG